MLQAEGDCHGTIAYAPAGDGGFGYDPLFQCETGETFADHAETVSVMGIIEAGNKALANPGEWVEV